MTKGLVLIVEDNEKNLKLVRDLLQYSGYKTIESVNAEDGIKLALEQQPALVLMDIQLPGMNGIDALAQLRSNPETANIPVIAVTASAMTDDKQQIMAAGFNGYLRKPLDLDEFIEAVNDIVKPESI
jgi:two-component system cell cycle response regulator DivK